MLTKKNTIIDSGVNIKGKVSALSKIKWSEDSNSTMLTFPIACSTLENFQSNKGNRSIPHGIWSPLSYSSDNCNFCN